MHFAQHYTSGLAHCSYVIGSGKECVVVDPARDIEPYLATAKSFGMKITAIIETHLHADFVSGHLDLQQATGATIYAPQQANCAFNHQALLDNEEFVIGDLKFKMIETPGHTPEGACFLVTDLARGQEPGLIFTGDTLLIGDVGRPDLFPNQEEELAEKLFDSLQKLKALPDYIEVYPAHGAGSLCGRDLSAKLMSTIGYEKRFNYALQHDDLAAFKKDLLSDMPKAPDHFARCSAINQKGPTVLKKLNPPQPLNVTDFAAKRDQGSLVVDTRTFGAFAAGHIPNAYSISLAGNLPTFAGWIVPPDQDILLIVENEKALAESIKALYSVGHDQIIGYLTGNVVPWINSGQEVETVQTISIHEFKSLLATDKIIALDNRAQNEYKNGHIPQTVLASTPDLREDYQKWSTDSKIYNLCNTSNRSMTAASLLKQKGFKNIVNVLGGTTAWANAGFEMVKGD